MIKNFFTHIKSFFTSNKEDLSMRIYSVIAAVIIWFIVAATIYQSTTAHIKNIPVNINIENTVAERNGLSIIDSDIPNVAVTIDGNRAVIGNMQEKDVEAKVDLSSVTSPGIYELPVEIAGKNNKDFSVVSIYPSTVKLNFVKIVTQEFDLQATAPYATAAEGYITETPIAYPEKIKITGPEDTVNKITKCVIKCNYKNTAMIEPYESTNENELIIYSGNVVLEQNNLKFDKTNFSVQIPVYQKKTVKLIPEFNNLPPNFPKDLLKYTQDVEEIEIAAPNGSRDSITLGVIDISEIDIGTVKMFPITLPDGYKNLSGIDVVTVTFDDENLAKKSFDISKDDIIVTNASSNYDISVVTSGFNVIFVGQKDVIEKLTIQDIVAEADLSSIPEFPNNEYFNAGVKFYVTSNECVWAIGKYNAAFLAKEIK